MDVRGAGIRSAGVRASESPGAAAARSPAWVPVREVLRCLRPGGRLVITAIRKESTDAAVMADIDYAGELWLENPCNRWPTLPAPTCANAWRWPHGLASAQSKGLCAGGRQTGAGRH